MATAFTTSEIIDAPIEQVFARITDWPGCVDWIDELDEMGADGESGVGTRLERRSGNKVESATITGWDPPSRVTLSSRKGNVVSTLDYTLVESGPDATKVTLHAECHTSGLVSVMAPLIRRRMIMADGDQIEDLKRVIER